MTTYYAKKKTLSVNNLPDVFGAVGDLVAGPNSVRKKNILRLSFSKQVKEILNVYSSHGDKTALTNYIKQQGIEITHRNMQRLISDVQEQNLLVSERSGYLILKYACLFFDLSIEKINEIAISIINDLLPQLDNYTNETY